MLQSRLLGDRNHWSSAVTTWSRLQGELAASRNADKTPRSVMREKVKKEGSGSDDQNKEGGKCILESRKRTQEQTEPGNESKRLRSDEQNGLLTLKGEREEDNNREAGEEGLQDISVVNNVVVADIESSREEDGKQNESCFKGIRSDHTTAGLEHTVENCNRTTNHLGVDINSKYVENGKQIQSRSNFCKDKTVLKAHKNKTTAVFFLYQFLLGLTANAVAHSPGASVHR